MHVCIYVLVYMQMRARIHEHMHGRCMYEHAYVFVCMHATWYTGVYLIFLISAQKHKLWVLVRTASAR